MTMIILCSGEDCGLGIKLSGPPGVDFGHCLAKRTYSLNNKLYCEGCMQKFMASLIKGDRVELDEYKAKTGAYCKEHVSYCTCAIGFYPVGDHGQIKLARTCATCRLAYQCQQLADKLAGDVNPHAEAQYVCEKHAIK